MTVRVRAPGHAIAPTVTLYLEEQEWSCDCGGRVDPCAHVAAAVIASAQPIRTGVVTGSVDSGKAKAPPRIVYRLTKKGRVLALARVVVRAGETDERIAGSLVSDLARGSACSRPHPTHDDLLIEQLLGAPPREVVPLTTIPRLFGALASGAEVTFQGEKTKVSGDPIAPRAIVEDAPGGGFVLRIEQDPAITEVVAMGVVRARHAPPARGGGDDRVLLERCRCLACSRRPSRRSSSRRCCPSSRRARRRHRDQEAPDDAQTTRGRASRWISRTRGTPSRVSPLLVYGDPPIARVDGDAVVALGERDVPVRTPRRGARAPPAPARRAGPRPGPARRTSTAPRRRRFAAKLRDWQKRVGERRATPRSSRAGRSSRAHRRRRTARFDVVFEHDGRRRRDETATHEARRRRRGAARLARRARPRPARRRRLGAAPRGLAREARPPRRRSARRARRDDEEARRAPRCPTSARSARRSTRRRRSRSTSSRRSSTGFDGIPHAPLPADLTRDAARLPAARRRLARVPARRRASARVLADDMGLGKTLQTLCVAARAARSSSARRASSTTGSRRSRASGPGSRTAIYHGPSASSIATRRRHAHDLRRAAPRRRRSSREDEWDTVVLDEAQAIKNADEPDRARGVRSCAASFRVALSGTPVENRLEELWSVMHFANPGLLGGRSELPGALRRADRRRRRRRRGAPAREDPAVRAPPHEARGRCPSCRRAPTPCSTSSSTRRSAASTTPSAPRRRRTSRASSREGGGVLAALEALLRLRQAACHPALVPGQQRRHRSSKIERLLEALEEAAADGHKALVFSQWTALLDLVEPHLAARRHPRSRASTARRAIAARVVSDVPGRGGPPVMLRLAQGRRHGPQPHRRRSRVPPRSVVEPGRRGSGRRPRAPHRPGQAR